MIDVNNSSNYYTGNGGGSTLAEATSGISNAYNTKIGDALIETNRYVGTYSTSATRSLV